MIGIYTLSELLKQYGIDVDKIIANNDNILNYGKYNDIKSTLDYLINELKISPRNIEKCPSIMYSNFEFIKINYEFLVSCHITITNVETCLNVLNSNPIDLKNTYNYVLNNYGIRYQ